jgi:predicted GH43/DUF377 family glycosyl hydrolase
MHSLFFHNINTFWSVLLTILSFITYSSALDNSTSLVRIGRRIYLLKDGVKHAFPDRFTMQRMGYNWATPSMKVLSGADAKTIPDGAIFPSLWDHHPNVKLMSRGNSKCIVSTKYLFPFSNPSIVLYKSEYVISWRNTPHSFRIVWLPSSKLSYSNIETNLEQLSQLDFAALPQLTLAGEDPRLFVSESNNTMKLMVVYATRYPRKLPEIRMSYTMLTFTGETISHGSVKTFNYEAERGREDQKNWSPFNYAGRVYYISSGQPHRITAQADTTELSLDIVKARTVSTSKVGGLERFWKHGEIRGGSPAVLLNGSYITFFHSSVIPPETGDVLRTYVFGAYLFEKDPPFAIKAMTKHPIIHESMYTGPWTNLPQSYYHIDYVAFPMSILLSEDQKSIHLIYGHQDVNGWVAKIDVTLLLESMTRVNTESSSIDS